MKLILKIAIGILFLSAGYSPAQIPKLDWPIETVSEGHGFTEGPVLTPGGQVLFSDMDNYVILRYDPHTASTTVWQEENRRSNGLYILNNHLYACEFAGRSLVRYDLASGPGSREVLVSNFQGDSLHLPNDLTIIENTLFFSDLGGGRLYTFGLSDRSLDTVVFDFTGPNGVARSPDGKLLYVADFGADKLYRARVEEGQAGSIQLFADLSPHGLSGPDGLAVLNDGRICLALYRSDRMIVISPDGKLTGYLDTGPLTSNCILAGDGRTLYVTADKKLKRVTIPD